MELSTRQAEVMDLVKSGMTGYGSAYVPVKYRVTVNSLIKRGLLKITGVEIAGMITVGLVEADESERVARVEVATVEPSAYDKVTVGNIEDAVSAVKQNRRVFTAEAHNFAPPQSFVRAMEAGRLVLIHDGDMSRYVDADASADHWATTGKMRQVAPFIVVNEPADKPSANPWGPCGPCDGTDAPMARKAHPCGLMTSGSTTVAVFTEAVTAVISEGDTVYRERDGHTGVVVAVNANSLDVEFFDGSERTASPLELLNDGYGVIPAAEVAEGLAAAEHASEAMINAAIAAGEAYAAAESVIWSGTGTLVKSSIRTHLNRRKRKATKRNRARVGGGF